MAIESTGNIFRGTAPQLIAVLTGMLFNIIDMNYFPWQYSKSHFMW